MKPQSIFKGWEPLRGRKPAGFSSYRGTFPRSGRKNSGMAGRAPPYDGLPCRGRKPVGFSSYREAYPQFWSKDQRHGRQSTPLRRLCFPFGRAMPP
ncbi:MAG: hypothetical protein LBK61_07795 [Spirochaetaceae bacterium]|nr:hypothetical protein [Spirochaetaceae bacterium]